MTKLEKVIDSLERCNSHVPDACRDCAYDDKPAPDCWQSLERDALELLKEQEAVKPFIRIHDANISNGTEHVCGNCNGSFLHQHVKFCPWCGRAVKWE